MGSASGRSERTARASDHDVGCRKSIRTSLFRKRCV
jgi:hypothetical protein